MPILSPNLAVFGDSLGRNMVASLQSLYPSLQIFNGGGSGESSTQITNRFMAYDDRGRITIIWSGHNSFRDPITVRTDIARIVANLGHQRYLVLGLVHEDQPSELPSGVDYPVKVALNEALATTYGPRFIDVREPIAAALNVGSAQDAADVRNGFTPSSLRVDGIHLNEAGSMIVARKVQERLRAWGW